MLRIAVFCFLLMGPVIALNAQSWPETNKQIVALYNKGQYKQGFDLAEKTLHQLKHISAPDSQYITLLQHLAIFCNRLGKFEQALGYEKSVMPLTVKTSGTEHMAALNTMGNTYMYMEQFAKADSVLQLGSKIASTQYLDSNTSPGSKFMILYQYCILRNSLGMLYKILGQYKNAQGYYEEVISLMKNELGEYVKDTEIYLTALNNLAGIYQAYGNTTASEEKYQEAAIAYARYYGDTSILYLNTMNNLASLYSNNRQFEKAEKIWREKIPILERTQSKNYSTYISMLINLSNVLFEQEKYKESRDLGLKAKKLQEHNFGTQNTTYQTILFNLAHVYQFEKNYTEADKYYKAVIAKMQVDIDKNFSYLSEQNKKAFYNENKLFIDEYSFFAVQKSGIIPFPDQPKKGISKASLGNLYDLQLSTKALILNATSRMRARILESRDTTLVNTYRKWEGLKESVAFAYGLSYEERKNLNLNPDSLANIVEGYEQYLARKSAWFEKGFGNKRASWKDIQKKLKPGEAAIEMIRFLDGLIYVALIITPETKLHPEAAVIKSSKDKLLDKQFYSLYINSIKNEMADTTSYNRFWKPVMDQLKKIPGQQVKKVWISPDGIYHKINLNTLQNSVSGKYVLEETDIHLLTNTKELLGMTKKKETYTGSAVLSGRPAYGNLTSDKTYRDLPGTEEEVREIERILKASHWKTTLLIDTAANETRIKASENPLVLHLATHGFFNPSGEQSVLNSGIVLAGVHNSAGHTSNDDGILTSYEAMSLHLDSTSLAVLSACETGLGEIENGEGVYGLQRTLKVAGVKTIMMSLWKIDDQATKELMTGFYKNWLGGETKREAFKRAQMELRQKYPNPYYWGAFVLVGE